MSENIFDIYDLSNTITDLVLQNQGTDRETLLVKITACLQRTIDTRLVPANFQQYQSKKKRENWIKTIQMAEFESMFWRQVVKELSGDNMQPYYNRISTLLQLKGFRKPPPPGSQITCFYCEREMDAAKFGGELGIHNTKDHVIPKSKFGKSDYKNLVSACNECNLLKSDLVIRQFIKKVQHMQEFNIAHEGIPIDRYPIIIKNAQLLLSI